MNEKFCPRCFDKFPEELDQCPACSIRLVAALDRDLTGQVLDDRYEILGTLGKGGMGVVYRAKQKIIDRPVALKVLRRELVQDESAVKRFMVEAKASSSLKSQHTITLFDFGITQQGLLYFTMELLDGTILTKAIGHEAPFTPERAVGIITQVCDSLKEAHGKGILHRDLKPDNIFLLPTEEGGEHVKVLDFGIAKILDDGSSESITKTGMVCGTPLYLSPEQAVGRTLDARSDLYSLGVILYEMLAGEPPFVDATPVGILMKQVNELPMALTRRNPNVEIPATLEQCLMRVLAKDPNDRPASAADFAKELAQALKGKTRRKVPMPGMMTTMAGVQLTTAEFYAQNEQPGATAPLLSEAGPARESDQSLAGRVTESSLDEQDVTPPRSRRGLYAGLGVAAVVAVVAVVLIFAFPPGKGDSASGQAAAPDQQEQVKRPQEAKPARPGGTAQLAEAQEQLSKDQQAAQAAQARAEKRSADLAAREALLKEKEAHLARSRELAEREKALAQREQAAKAAEVAAQAAALAQAEAAAKAKVEEEAAEHAAEEAAKEAARQSQLEGQAERAAQAAAAKKRAEEARKKSEKARAEQKLAEAAQAAAEAARKKAEAERKKAAAEKKQEKQDDEPDFEDI